MWCSRRMERLEKVTIEVVLEDNLFLEYNQANWLTGIACDIERLNKINLG